MPVVTLRHRLVGVLVFLIALVLYLKTLAPTVSFWDCGEFIACSYILGVPHPPGAPLYILLGKLFTYLPVGDIGYRKNLMSAVFAAGSIGVLYLLLHQLTARMVLYLAVSLFLAFSYYFWITAEPERKPGTLWWGPGSAQGYHYTQNFDPVPGLDYAVQLLDDGYIMEVSITMGTNGLAANSADWQPPFLGRTIGFMLVAVDKDDARNLPFAEMVRLSEGDGSYDWGEIAWCGSDDRQSGWGNLVYIDHYDPDKHRLRPRYLE